MNVRTASQRIIPVKPLLLFLGIFFCVACQAVAEPGDDTLATSTRQQAFTFIDKIKVLAPSPHWPNIKPVLFLRNIKSNISNPISIYPGNGTNFCGYGALTYLFLQDDPLGYDPAYAIIPGWESNIPKHFI